MLSPSPMQESAALPLFTPYIRTTRRKSAARAASGSRRPSPGLWNKTASGDVYLKKELPPGPFPVRGAAREEGCYGSEWRSRKGIIPLPRAGCKYTFFGEMSP